MSEEPGPPRSVNVFILDQAQISSGLSIAFHPEVLQSSSGVVHRQIYSGFWDSTDPAAGRLHSDVWRRGQK